MVPVVSVDWLWENRQTISTSFEGEKKKKKKPLITFMHIRQLHNRHIDLFCLLGVVFPHRADGAH